MVLYEGRQRDYMVLVIAEAHFISTSRVKIVGGNSCHYDLSLFTYFTYVHKSSGLTVFMGLGYP